MKPTVLLVDDSELILSELSLILRESDLFSRILKARDGEDAIRVAMKEHPTNIVLDLQMPRMDGFTFLRWIMANQPVPVLVFSSMGTDDNIFRAMDIGAVDFVTKPDTYIDDRFRNFFLEKIHTLLEAQVQPVRKRRAQAILEPPREPKPKHTEKDIAAIVIGASTGGPTAIQSLLETLQTRTSIPILVCQHMPRAFTSVFAQRLNLLLDMTVREATSGERLQPGTVYICPGNVHMTVQDGRIELVEPALSDLYTPSVDRLFESAAMAYKDKVVAVVLTGMGKDGSEGARAVAATGGYLIAESAETCVIHGMPKATVATGCPVEQLPLDRIGSRILEIVSG